MLLLILALTALYVSVVSAVQTVKVEGSNFVNTVTGARLQIIGVAYQPGGSSGFQEGSDPLSDGKICLRDAALMQKLGVNTIRVYNLDPTANHDECASIFNAVGIYMVIDVNSPLGGQSLVPGVQLKGSYNAGYLKHVFGVVEAFKDYNNTLGFFGGNEDMNDIPSGGQVPPYLRAITRDLKNYIAKNAKRTIPVGYSAADVREILADSWAYLSCDVNGDKDDMSRIDFFGLNSYSWCGSDATFQSAGYDKLMTQFADTTIPVFFSEYGCNKVMPRVFDEVSSLYGDEMIKVLSGGLVYEYTNQTDDFGLVQIDDSDQSATLGVDYDNLQKQFNKLDVKSLETGNSTAKDLKSPKCNKSLIVSSSFNSSFTIPSIPSGGQKLIDNGIDKPNNGKMVAVTDTKVSQKVYDSNGKLLDNLAIQPLKNDESNSPNGQDTLGPSSTSSGASPTSTKKSAAGRVEIGACAVFGAAALLFAWQ